MGKMLDHVDTLQNVATQLRNHLDPFEQPSLANNRQRRVEQEHPIPNSWSPIDLEANHGKCSLESIIPWKHFEWANRTTAVPNWWSPMLAADEQEEQQECTWPWSPLPRWVELWLCDHRRLPIKWPNEQRRPSWWWSTRMPRIASDNFDGSMVCSADVLDDNRKGCREGKAIGRGKVSKPIPFQLNIYSTWAFQYSSL